MRSVISIIRLFLLYFILSSFFFLFYQAVEVYITYLTALCQTVVSCIV